MTTLLKLFSGLFGYDYGTVVLQPTISKQKIVTLGTLMAIPVLLWAVSGFYLSHFMMGVGLLGSLAVGAVMGGIILIVDRSFVATPKTGKSGWLMGMRLAFAIFSTVLGSLAIDMMLFAGDLDEYRQAKGAREKTEYRELYMKDHDSEVQRLLVDLGAAKARHAELIRVHFDELDGKGGTGQYGSGKVAAAKEREKDRAEREAERLEGAYKAALTKLEAQAGEYAKKMSEKHRGALLSQLIDLHEFILSDGVALGFYLFFFGFILMLEAFFMLYKASVGQSIFEHMLQAEEDYAYQKLEIYRAQKARLERDRGLLGEDHDRVKKLVGGGRRQRLM